MALDTNIQKYISTQIASQFPRFYEEYGPVFIDFVTEYYRWMETDGPLYDSRRAADYQDIDTTVDRFIIFFKNKYLSNIQLQTNSNVKLLVKHSLDIYRSRGTERSIDLLFRLVFGAGADVYYPWDDVFKTSDGEWIIPRYLEVSTQDDLNKFVGKEVEGLTSGATAFVESWVRKKYNGRQLDMLYISGVIGDFTTGERINAKINPFPVLECPSMIGSLTELTIIDGASGFNIGDIVPVTGQYGYGGIARVANTSTQSGLVQFDLTDGGWGYTVNAQVLISEKVLTLANLEAGGTGNNYFLPFETLSQPLANINYVSAVGGLFQNNDSVFTYFPNNAVKGQGLVLSKVDANSTAGFIKVSVISGNLNANAIYNAGNTVSANLPVSNGYTSATATGNVIAESQSFIINVFDAVGTFQPGEVISQNVAPYANATVVAFNSDGSVGTLYGKDRIGVFQTNTTIYGQTSGATATLDNLQMNMGVIDVDGAFVSDSRAIVYADTSNTSAYLYVVNQGTGASANISQSLLYPQTIAYNDDYLRDYLTVDLDDVYGFPALPTANLLTIMADAFHTVNTEFGRISGLIGLTPGTGYNIAPFVRIYEEKTFPAHVFEDRILTITGLTASFIDGEAVTQAASGAQGLVLSSNNSVMLLQRMSFNTFVPTSNSTTYLVGVETGAQANIISVDDNTTPRTHDIGAQYLGFDAEVDTSAVIANGTIESVTIAASGWGYLDGETVQITSTDGTVIAAATARLRHQGKSQGYYRTKGGFLSDTKKLQDNDYYQVSSYEVRSSVTLDKYEDMLKQLLHVSGTRYFGALYWRGTASANVNITAVRIRQE